MPTSGLINRYPWLPTDCTVGLASGGQAGNCAELTRTGGSLQYVRRQLAGLTVGKCYKFTGYVKSGTSGNENYYVAVESAQPGHPLLCQVSGSSSASWVQFSGYFTHSRTTRGYTL